jgi:hypothetical protein
LSSAAGSALQRPAAFRSRTEDGLSTTRSPDGSDSANRFSYIGSMRGEVPVMFAIVAAGAIARTLELRLRRAEREALAVARVMEPRTPSPTVGGGSSRCGRLRGIEVDVGRVVERADGDADGLAGRRVIELAARGEVLVEHDRAEVADRRPPRHAPDGSPASR